MDSETHKLLLEKVKAYQVPAAAIELLKEHPPLLIAGTTAAGKETIIWAIQDAGSGGKVVTHTTRPMRAGEQNGKDYWFVNEAEMLQLLDKGGMIEVKNIHNQQISGPSISAYQDVINRNLQPLLAVDVMGIEEIMVHLPHLRPVFILPPSFDEWMERLDKRGHMSHVERLRRLNSARAELEKAASNRRFVLVVNKQIAQTVHEVLGATIDELTQNQNRELAQQLIAHIKAY